ncbi:uncharacterized protein LOC112603273 isoform X2 [Melanaphis sacchari]|uniref:uncharacterized protein LOC112603273 isoform X2 n=1 Tax=Melanaphis sacchari TaxID=742174 RepID=UPI000DC130AA|nr:uncharacterized protein LOC112603273 isoform X2 [Melanaphis sacchari]
MIMDTTSTANIAQQQSPAYGLMKRGKRGAAALIAADCCNAAVDAASTQQQQDDGSGDAAAADSALTRCKLLDDMLDVLLNPYDAIGEWNNLDWLRWLMAGGKTLDEFSSAVKVYDYGTCCGLVWTANYVAYRCRTCSISPCMSLCGDCFKRGDHTGHDFNMFRSQAGGACDCGDTSVMKPDGFCRKHSSTNNIDGTSTSSNSSCKQPPADLLRVAERIMPRLLLRLVQYLRENSKIADSRTSNTHVPPGGVTGAGAGMTNQQQNLLLIDLDPFLGMLHDLGALGAAMRRVMTVSLTNERIYRWACDYYSSTGNFGSDSNIQQQQQQQQQTIYTIYTDKVRRYYAEAIHQYTTSTSSSSSNRRRRRSNTRIEDGVHGSNSVSNSEDDNDYDDDEFGQDDWLVDGQNSSGQKNKLNHSSFLQEIVFWTVRYEFPQKMVCFLLNMLPDAAYKEALTEAFVMHYGCVARVLATTRDSDTLSNHIVHISVQLFSNEALALRMVDKLGLLGIMVSSLRRMMTKILIPSTLHDPSKNKHRVVDCSKAVMKEHCYWPLVSDLNNVLSHRPIAVKFMCDDRLLDSWFSYLSMFQGMNVNCRELGHHVEFEPNTYYAAFSAELEASAYPMWAMLSHLTSTETLPLSYRVLRACLKRLRKWLVDVGYYNQDQSYNCDSIASSSNNSNASTSTNLVQRLDDRHQFTFHLPLHRYLAVFLCQAVRAQSARIEDIIPRSNKDDSADRDSLLTAIASHPVRAQSAFYEIMQGAWVRNGLQIKGQAMTYIQSNFCISMVDADIYLLQLCLSELSDANIFMSLILEKFKVYDWMHVVKHGGLPQVMDSEEYDAAPSMESLLVFLATLIGVRTNLCSDEDYDYCQSQLEMVTLLCVSDKTHSQLMELMPERCGGIQTSATTTASSISTSGDSASRNPSSLDQVSPPSMRDFETVLQAVAEYKRPQFEASGNMQQGLYVPLPHVWKKLYDPVHVLLRAVHRRDFQSSMDRYTTFMRSIGVLKQNQNTWPPYRMPQKHHPAYRNPCRALLSKLFHAVVWHCLYRSAVYRDISEHTLSLLVYLLDQAWICYDSSFDNKTSNNQQQPMDTDPPTEQSESSSSTSAASSRERFYENRTIKNGPKRKIKITVADTNNSDNEAVNAKETTLLLLNHWYDHDDLAYNLCTTITHVELPPPYYHYFFGEEATNATSNVTAASTMATNLFDYFTSSVAAATSVASSSSPITVSHNFEPGNSQQQPNVVPSLATIAGNEIPLAGGSSIPTRPPFYSLNAAAAATSSTMDSALNRVKQRLQFLRPLPKTDSLTQEQHQSSSSSSSSSDIPVIDLTIPEFPFEDMRNTDNETSILGVDKNTVIEVDEQQNSLVCINESIISLLLKLHSQLSGEPDSYQLPVLSSQPTTSNNLIDDAKINQSASDNDNSQEDMPPCGDGAFFVGRLLDRIAKGSKKCYDCILRTRAALWPIAVVMRETASRDDEERERRERKRRARDKQQQMMEEMARAQRAFLESARRSGDLDSADTQSQSTSGGTSSNMECDILAPTVELSTPTVCSSEATTSMLANTIVEIDENSSSSNNSTTTTTKESTTNIPGSDQHKNKLTVDCVICNQTVVVQIEQQQLDPIGLVILVQGTNVLAHRRHIVSQPIVSTNLYNISNINATDQQQPLDPEKATGVTSINSVENSSIVNNEQNYYHYWPALPPLNSQQHHQQSSSVANDPKSLQQHNQPIVTTIADNYDATTYASHSDRRKRLMSQYFNNLDKADFEVGSLTTTTSATPIGGNVHVQTCGHHLHLRCWSSYLASLRGAQRFNADRGEYSCPLCRQLANSLMPLIPELSIHQNQRQRGCAFLNNIITASAMSDAVSKLTELVKQQEYDSPNPEQSGDAVCCSETSTSVFIGDTENIVNRHPLHQNVHHHHFNDDEYFPVDDLRDISPTSGEEEIGGNGGEREDFEFEEDPLLSAVNKCVSDMITTTVVTAAAQTVSLPHTLLSSTQRENMYKVRWHSVVSVAWTNIQVELVQRNNSLIEQLQQDPSSLHSGNNYYCRLNLFSTSAVNSTDINSGNNYYNMLPKRNCIAPLLKVLRVSARSLMARYQTSDYSPISDVWYKLIGCDQPRQQYSNTYPPLMMRDPCSVLLQLVLLLPTLDRDLFDTLIKLTYNMQLYIAALKVASTWNRNCKFNHQLYHRRRHHSSLNTRKISTKTEEKTDEGTSVQMDLDDGRNNKLSSLSIDITEFDNRLPCTPLFSQVVALAKTIVFLSDDDETEIVNISSIVNNDNECMMHQEDESVENVVSNDKLDRSIDASENDEENMLLLESYGRRSTLPFLRFAALLKKYINGDDDDNPEDHPEFTMSSSQLNNLNVEQSKQKEQLLDGHAHPSHNLSPPSVEVNYNVNFSTPNDPHHYQHWSKDDYEYLMLARYLKLLNNEEAHEVSDNCEDTYNYSCSYMENNDDQNQNNYEKRLNMPLLPPSAMEAVIWPHWSYSTNEKNNKISTTISRTWFTSFRESLTTKIPKATIIGENTTTIVSSAAAEIDPNSKATTSANIIMAARMLLFADCCDSDDTNAGVLDSSRSLFPPINWTGPRLLKLPHLYDDVFQYYHGRACHRCHGVPRETSVCLVCGTVVCLKENCCKTNHIYEAVQHSLECGGGTGMFLVVTSSSVVVIRGKRACLWGSVYLDAFGEEDRELKRGKPLYLSAERYRLLEHQWLAHRFDHTNKKWVWHRDAL